MEAAGDKGWSLMLVGTCLWFCAVQKHLWRLLVTSHTVGYASVLWVLLCVCTRTGAACFSACCIHTVAKLNTAECLQEGCCAQEGKMRVRPSLLSDLEHLPDWWERIDDDPSWQVRI